MSGGDFKGAVEAYTKAIELDGANHVLFSNRSAAYASLEQFDKALEDAERTLALKSDFVKGYSRKGLALFKLEKFREAMQAYQAGLALEPGNEALQAGVRDVQAALQDRMQGQMSQMFARLFNADTKYKLRSKPDTLKLLEKDPAFARMIDECVADPAANVSRYISDPRMQQALGVLLEIEDGARAPSAEEVEGARRQREAELRREDDARERRRREEKERAEREERERAERAAAALSPEQAEAERAKAAGNELFKARDFAGALEQYRRASALDPQNLLLLTNQASAQMELGDARAAVETCRRAVELGREARADFAHIAKALARMGAAYMRLGEFEAAVDAYQRSLTEKRDRAVVEQHRKAELALKKKREEDYVDVELGVRAREQGNECFKEGKNPQAVEFYTEAIKRNPKDHLALSNRAAAFLRLGAAADAVKDCEAALQLDPAHVKSYLRLGQAQVFMKQSYKAVETYQKGLRHAPDHRDAALEEALAAAMMASRSAQSSEEAADAAMRDPEIQQILQDPAIQKVLQDMQSDPKSISYHLQNPAISERINKLVMAGVLKVR